MSNIKIEAIANPPFPPAIPNQPVEIAILGNPVAPVAFQPSGGGILGEVISLPPIPPGGGEGYSPAITSRSILAALIGQTTLSPGFLLFGGDEGVEARLIGLDDIPTVPAEKTVGTFTDDQIPASIARDSEVASAIEALTLLLGAQTEILDGAGESETVVEAFEDLDTGLDSVLDAFTQALN